MGKLVGWQKFTQPAIRKEEKAKHTSQHEIHAAALYHMLTEHTPNPPTDNDDDENDDSDDEKEENFNEHKIK